MRMDRLRHEQAGMPLEEAIWNEFDRGLKVIRSGETQEGAARFAAGAGRHGSFD
jgi:enoyl-CoA hydratase